MKGKNLLLLSIMITKITQANVLTVSNDPTRPAQYNTLSAAFAAANAGDTLYLYGSPSSYGDLTITKSIAIIGGGFNTRSEKFYQSPVGNLTFDNNVNGVKLEGITSGNLYINSISAFTYGNISIKNCFIYGEIQPTTSIPCGAVLSNWLIQNSIIYYLDLGYNSSCSGISPATTNFLVKNCDIRNISSRGNYNISFVNCQFGYSAGVSPGSMSGEFSAERNCTFDNCQFLKFRFYQNSTSVNNLFHNCLTYLTYEPNANFDLNNWPDGTPNSATGTIVNQNPLWVTEAPNIFGVTQYYTHISWDPLLQGGSPAHNAGTDGTDIGLTGGTTPYNYHAEPNIPIVRSFQIVNSIVPPNGTLNVKSTATKAQ